MNTTFAVILVNVLIAAMAYGLVHDTLRIMP
jgi:hypothetical protein